MDTTFQVCETNDLITSSPELPETKSGCNSPSDVVFPPPLTPTIKTTAGFLTSQTQTPD